MCTVECKKTKLGARGHVIYNMESIVLKRHWAQMWILISCFGALFPKPWLRIMMFTHRIAQGIIWYIYPRLSTCLENYGSVTILLLICVFYWRVLGFFLHKCRIYFLTWAFQTCSRVDQFSSWPTSLRMGPNISSSYFCYAQGSSSYSSYPSLKVNDSH